MKQRDGILIVDDDKDACETLVAALRQSGYAAASVRDGFEAMEWLKGSVPDLVLSDLCMPGMTGLELIQRIQQANLDPPVILMTGADTRDLCTGASTYGAVTCLEKPIRLDELLWAIDCALVCNRAADAATTVSPA